MGFGKTERGIGGDSWADEFDRMMGNLSQDGVWGSKLYGADTHTITMAELADLVEFCTRGHLVVEIRHPEDAARPLSELHAKGVATYPNRGQIHRPEVCVIAPL